MYSRGICKIWILQGERLLPKYLILINERNIIKLVKLLARNKWNMFLGSIKENEHELEVHI